MIDRVILNVKGHNISNFIRKLNKKKIEIYKIKNIKKDSINIEIDAKDYDNLIKLKTIYEVNIIKYKGINRVKQKIIFNKYIILSIIIGIIIFTILTNIIFNIEILNNNSKIRKLITDELNRYGLTKYSIAKNYNELSHITNEIIDNNKDRIEWLEIERVGTKYIIKVEPRIINDLVDDNKIYNIVSTKDCIIKNVEALSGEIIRNVNDYVKKGDVVISSNITLNEEVKSITSAKGKIYGESWYKVNISYPLNYYEEKDTGKKKDVFNLKIINKDFNFSKLKKVKKDDKIIFKSDLLPIVITRQHQREYEEINYKLTKEEAIKKASDEARNKIKEKLDRGEYIINEKSLKIDMKESKIEIEMFYTVYEDVTQYLEMEG